MYDFSRGVPQDHTKAAKWYRKAAEQGYSGAQLNLGLMYSKGQGVPQDYILAHKWYTVASVTTVADATGMPAAGRSTRNTSRRTALW